MTRAQEITVVSPRYAIWHAYDRACKSEVFSTAVRTGGDLALVDPIALSNEALAELGGAGQIAAIFVSNVNHARATADFAQRNAAAVFVPAELLDEFPSAKILTDKTRLLGLEGFAIPGAATGEFALYDEREGGTLIVGDALINFEPHGFSLLPAKYCTDRRTMIRSLGRLLDLPLTRIFFAHGYPIIMAARHRLAALLDDAA